MWVCYWGGVSCVTCCGGSQLESIRACRACCHVLHPWPQPCYAKSSHARCLPRLVGCLLRDEGHIPFLDIHTWAGCLATLFRSKHLHHCYDGLLLTRPPPASLPRTLTPAVLTRLMLPRSCISWCLQWSCSASSRGHPMSYLELQLSVTI